MQATGSRAAFRGAGVIASFELGEPSISFVGGRVQAGRLIVVLRGDGGLPELLALFTDRHQRRLLSR